MESLLVYCSVEYEYLLHDRPRKNAASVNTFVGVLERMGIVRNENALDARGNCDTRVSGCNGSSVNDVGNFAGIIRVLVCHINFIHDKGLGEIKVAKLFWVLLDIVGTMQKVLGELRLEDAWGGGNEEGMGGGVPPHRVKFLGVWAKPNLSGW